MEKTNLLEDFSPLNSPSNSGTKSNSSQNVSSTFAVQGMTCGACVSAITNGLESLEGVVDASVSLVTERAAVTFDPDIVSSSDIKERIEDCGFDARLISENIPRTFPSSNLTKIMAEKQPSQPSLYSATVAISGMTCGACSASITNNLEALDGITSVAISLVTERGAIEFDPTITSTDKIIQEIEDSGFDANLISSSPISQHSTNDSTSQSLSSSNQEKLATQTLKLKVYGMTCSSCSTTVENVLRSLPGVLDALVNLVLEEATVYYDPALTGARSIVEAIEGAGFNAILASTADNALQLESLSKVKAINRARNQLIFSTLLSIPVIMLSHLTPKPFKFLAPFKSQICMPGLYLDDIVNMILTIPIQFVIGARFYTATLKAVRHRSLTMDVLVCLSTSCAFFFSILIIIVSIIQKAPNHPHTLWETSAMIITFILAGKYLENKAKGRTSSALSRLIQLSPSMATIYTNTEQYDNATKNALESDFANTSLSGNSDNSTNNESRLETKSIPTELIQHGDIVLVLPGEKIPADGIVIRGETYADESFVTGESMSVSKTNGSQVICGSINGFGRIDVRVTHSGSETKLSHIVQLVQDAQTSKTSMQRYADYVAGFFVPTVIILGLLTFAGWLIFSYTQSNLPKIFLGPSGKFIGSLTLAISVIVVACPCALGLATPTAVMVGTGVGASNGILIKGGAVLETASRVTTVLFDKTGTLTTGDMNVSSFDIVSTVLEKFGLTSVQWWKLVGCTEQGSEHPIARGIMKMVKSKCGLSENAQVEGVVENFVVSVGLGISANVKVNQSLDFMKVLIGSSKMMDQSGIVDIPESIRELESQSVGQSLVLVSINGVYAGYISIADTIRENARATVSALKKLGYSVGIVSGDHPSVVSRVAKEVGISKDMVWGGVSPEGKLEIVDQLESDDLESSIGAGHSGRSSFSMLKPKRRKEIVAMVGDGINDSPALAHASLGISMAGATDIAMDAADIVLLKENSLLDVAAAFQLCGRIFSCIRLNLIWAIIYNAITIPIAMGLLLPWGIVMHPVIAGGAMACSSVSVVCNSLLLQLWKRPKWLRKLYEETGTASDGTDNIQSRPREWFSNRQSRHTPVNSVDFDYDDEGSLSEAPTVVGSPASATFPKTEPSSPKLMERIKSAFGVKNSNSKKHKYSLLPQ